VNLLVKLFGGNKDNIVNGKRKMVQLDKKDVVVTLLDVLIKNVFLKILYVIGEEKKLILKTPRKDVDGFLITFQEKKKFVVKRLIRFAKKIVQEII